jgi:excinuclease ABC subunit A
LHVLNRLVDSGNTVIVIEHNLDVIKSADWVIDLGPDGGYRGGQVVGTGTPENLAANRASYTGAFLNSLVGPPSKKGELADVVRMPSRKTKSKAASAG